MPSADHVEFPRLKPDRYLLAFSNVAVDITGGNMVIKEFGECTGRVARSFNDIKFKKKYAKLREWVNLLQAYVKSSSVFLLRC